jgi:hypothetical protein
LRAKAAKVLADKMSKIKAERLEKERKVEVLRK